MFYTTCTQTTESTCTSVIGQSTGDPDVLHNTQTTESTCTSVIGQSTGDPAVLHNTQTTEVTCTSVIGQSTGDPGVLCGAGDLYQISPDSQAISLLID